MRGEVRLCALLVFIAAGCVTPSEEPIEEPRAASAERIEPAAEVRPPRPAAILRHLPPPEPPPELSFTLPADRPFRSIVPSPTMLQPENAEEILQTAYEVFEIEAPIRFIDFHSYPDGGTVGWTLLGANRQIPVCLARPPGGDLRLPREFFVGAHHPTKEGAIELPYGSKKERAMVDLMQLYVDSRLWKKQQEELRGKTHLVTLWEQAYSRDLLRVFEQLEYLERVGRLP